MPRALTLSLLLALLASCRASGGGEVVVHDVYFALTDDSPEATAELVDACHAYLADLPGVVRFAAGTREAERAGPVNDVDFDVSLHVWFEDAAAYAAYDTAPRHLEFVEAFRGNWASVRVFDSNARTR